MEMLPRMINSVLTLTTGGGVGKRTLFSVKSSTRKVADMITNLSGFPFCTGAHGMEQNINTDRKTEWNIDMARETDQREVISYPDHTLGLVRGHYSLQC